MSDLTELLAGLRRESCATESAARTCADVLASLEKAFERLQELFDRGELIEGGLRRGCTR